MKSDFSKIYAVIPVYSCGIMTEYVMDIKVDIELDRIIFKCAKEYSILGITYGVYAFGVKN